MDKVEKAAVNAMSDVINRCDRLEDHFSSGDKMPITDGTIDFYKVGKHSNKNLLHRVPVQNQGQNKEGQVQSASFRKVRDLPRGARVLAA